MRIPFSLFLLVIGSSTVLSTHDRSERAIKSKPVVSKKTELVEEGSGAPLKELSAAPADLELHSSGNGGYSSDDEDGDDIQGSGAPPSDKVEGSGSPPLPVATTSTTSAPIVTGTRSTTTTHAVFNPVQVIPDPVVHVEEKNDHDIVTEIREPAKLPPATTAVAPTTTSRRIIPASPDDIPTGSPFSPIPKPGIVAALIGGAVIGLITAVLLVMFIVHRMRKKDEGSYALDEPKPRPYSNYPYSKAPQEFYA